MSPMISLLLGLALLFAGRSLFWLFVAGAGFLYGLTWAPTLFPHQPQMVILAIAVGLGLLGALLAMLVQKLAIGLAGALIGGHLAMQLAGTGGLAASSGSSLVLFVIGAVLGLIFVLALFDWALIVLSALMGASLIVDFWRWPHDLRLLLMAGLALVGVCVQAAVFQRRRGLAS